ncbi:MAG: MMPL family transporter, partial [Phycisphaerae bacterium]
MTDEPYEPGREVWLRRLLTYAFSHRWVVLTGTALVLVVCAISATGLHWSENVADLLPKDDPVVSAYCRLLERFDLMDYVYFEVGSASADHEVDEAELAARADALYDRLASSSHFQKIIYRWDAKDFFAAVQQITRHRAQLFGAEDVDLLVDKLTYDAIRNALADWKAVLTASPAPLLSQSFYEDPLRMNGLFVDKLRTMRALGAPLEVHEGRLFSRDLKHALIIALPRFPSTDSFHAEELIAFLEGVIGELEGATDNRVRISYFGGHRASLENARQIKSDIKRTIALSVLIIALLSAAIYRRTWLVLLTFTPAVFGATLATGLIRWLDPSVSAISLGCGSMLIGISVDYAVHILYGADQLPNGSDAHAGVVRIVRRLFLPVVLSASTTLAAFCVLHFSVMPGYRGLGHFGALGITAAAVFSLMVLPIIVPGLLLRARRNPLLCLTGVFQSVLTFGARRRLRYGLFVVLMCLFSLQGLTRLRVEGDIRKMNSVSGETQQEWDRVVEAFGDVMSSTAFAVQGEDLEQALQMNEALAHVLADAQRHGDVTTIDTVAWIMPSLRVQESNQTRWRRFWTAERLERLRADLDRACVGLRIRPEAFTEFLRSLPGSAPLMEYEDYAHSPLGTLLTGQVSASEHGVTLLTRVKLADPDAFSALAADVRGRLPGAIAFNARFFARRIVELIHEETLRLGAIAFGAVLVILCIFVRSPNLIMALLLPLLASLVWTFGLMGWLGIRLNMMNGAV